MFDELQHPNKVTGFCYARMVMETPLIIPPPLPTPEPVELKLKNVASFSFRIQGMIVQNFIKIGQG